MDQEEIDEEYLRSYGWIKLSERLWVHKDSSYEFCLEKAIMLQNYRNGLKPTPSLFKGIFNWIKKK
jgi:hypothetical protein